jgi:hypothetical protein
MSESPSYPEQWFENMQKALGEKFKDITNIEIITAIAEDVSLLQNQITSMEDLKSVQINRLSYYARTTMQLDGDNYTLLPSGPDPTVADKVREVHENHVTSAVRNWNQMAKVAFTGLYIVATVVGVNKEQLKDTKDLIETFNLQK